MTVSTSYLLQSMNLWTLWLMKQLKCLTKTLWVLLIQHWCHKYQQIEYHTHSATILIKKGIDIYVGIQDVPVRTSTDYPNMPINLIGVNIILCAVNYLNITLSFLGTTDTFALNCAHQSHSWGVNILCTVKYLNVVLLFLRTTDTCALKHWQPYIQAAWELPQQHQNFHSIIEWTMDKDNIIYCSMKYRPWYPYIVGPICSIIYYLQ